VPFGFGSRGTLSHEFFKPLAVTFDFSAMVVYLTRTTSRASG
jgi:hypothetical protein